MGVPLWYIYIAMFNPHLLYRGFMMINMFKQLFSMFNAFFIAGEKLGNTAVNFATWAEEGSGAFADQARADRKKKLESVNRTNTKRITK